MGFCEPRQNDRARFDYRQLYRSALGLQPVPDSRRLIIFSIWPRLTIGKTNPLRSGVDTVILKKSLKNF